MSPEKYIYLKKNLIELGYKKEIDWGRDLKPCEDSESFVLAFIWVICNSGMKNQIAELIYSRILNAIIDKKNISEVFGHKGKVSAIKKVLKNQNKIFAKYQNSNNKIDFLKTLPWIGNITKYHLAKNLGVDCVKPDRHLIRIAKHYNLDVLEMCQKLSKTTGDSLCVVDLIIWRSANLKLI